MPIPDCWKPGTAPGDMLTNMRAVVLMLLLGSLLGCASPGEPPLSEKPQALALCVFGDSRAALHMPFTSNEEVQTRWILEDFFRFIYGEDAAALAKKVPLIYDKATKKLQRIEIPLSKSESGVLRFEGDWTTEIAYQNGPVRSVIFRPEGGAWVLRQVTRAANSGRCDLVIHTGNMVWWGYQGRTIEKSPYWKKFSEDLLENLPPPDEEMKSAGLEGRFFPAIGNHDTWGDEKLEGLLSSFPYLRGLGVSPDTLIYTFDFKGARFIFLHGGHRNYRSPSSWESKKPAVERQKEQLKAWLHDAKTKGIRSVFVTLHMPVFARSGPGAIPIEEGPHGLLASYAKDLDITVFSGHIHTTEVYFVDGVRYLVLGGGGAEQFPILKKQGLTLPQDYPKDLYWGGEERIEDYNYLIVNAGPGDKRFTIHRYRPGTSEPLQEVELFREPRGRTPAAPEAKGGS